MIPIGKVRSSNNRMANIQGNVTSGTDEVQEGSLGTKNHTDQSDLNYHIYIDKQLKLQSFTQWPGDGRMQNAGKWRWTEGASKGSKADV